MEASTQTRIITRRNPLFIKSEFSRKSLKEGKQVLRACQVAILYSSSQNSLCLTASSRDCRFMAVAILYSSSQNSLGILTMCRRSILQRSVAILYSSSQNSLGHESWKLPKAVSSFCRNPLFIKSEFSRPTGLKPRGIWEKPSRNPLFIKSEFSL